MTIVQRIRVPAGFLFAVVFLCLAQPRTPFSYAGISLAATGLALRIWASGYLKKGQELAVYGPYRWTRNPLYLGSFLLGLGFSLAGSRLPLLTIFLILFLAIYIPVMRNEEKELLRNFGSQYTLYRQEVPLFVPRLRQLPSLASTEVNFQWKQVVLNGEYEAVAGFVLLTAFVLIRTPWE